MILIDEKSLEEALDQEVKKAYKSFDAHCYIDEIKVDLLTEDDRYSITLDCRVGSASPKSELFRQYNLSINYPEGASLEFIKGYFLAELDRAETAVLDEVWDPKKEGK